MKKIYLILFAFGVLGIVSCGPSAEEKKKMEAEATAKADSLFNAANQNIAASDSASTAKTDSTAK